MKGYLSLLLGSFIFAMMLAMPGNAAQAKVVAPEEGQCNCPVTYFVGAEGNKWVAELFKSDEFKMEKKSLTEQGYKWNGADEMSVVKFNEGTGLDGVIMIRAPFYKDGVREWAVFQVTTDGFIVWPVLLPDEAIH